MLDVGSTITDEQRTALFIGYCAFSIALSILRIPTNLSVFSDTNVQVEIKNQDMNLTEVDLQKVLDTLSLRRKVSDLVRATEFVQSKFSEQSASHSLFVFTDGLLINTNTSVWDGRITEDSKLTCIILPRLDQDSTKKLKDGYAVMNNLAPRFNYTFLEAADDIYTAQKSVIKSFVTGIKESKAPKLIKESIRVIIPSDPICLKRKFINEREQQNTSTPKFFITKKEMFQYEPRRLPRVLLMIKWIHLRSNALNQLMRYYSPWKHIMILSNKEQSSSNYLFQTSHHKQLRLKMDMVFHCLALSDAT
jgi:hypothetical protein